jgi:hypothetical protein
MRSRAGIRTWSLGGSSKVLWHFSNRNCRSPRIIRYCGRQSTLPQLSEVWLLFERWHVELSIDVYKAPPSGCHVAIFLSHMSSSPYSSPYTPYNHPQSRVRFDETMYRSPHGYHGTEHYTADGHMGHQRTSHRGPPVTYHPSEHHVSHRGLDGRRDVSSDRYSSQRGE